MKNFKIKNNKSNKYKCALCNKVIKRKSSKKWIKAYCTEKDRYTRLIIQDNLK